MKPPNTSKNGESFVPFLEAMRGSEASSSADTPSGEISIQFLRELDAHGPETVPDLMKTMRIDVVRFANALKTLQSAGLVEVVSAAGEHLETVSLTKVGRQLARVGNEMRAL